MVRGKSESGHAGRVGGLAVGSAILVTLVVGASGCSSTASKDASSSAPSVTSASNTGAPTTPSPTTAASTTASVSIPPTTSIPSTSASVAQTSGSYLKTLLPSPNQALSVFGNPLPAGWTAHADEEDSGPTAKAPAASLVSAGTCDYLISKDTSDLSLASGLSVGTASESLGNGTSGVGLAFYAYNPGDAAKSLAQIRQSITSDCDDFTVMLTAGHVDMKVSATPVSGLGDEAMLVRAIPQGPYISEENLLVRRGNVVMSLSSNNVHGDLPDLTPAASTLVTGMG